MNWQILGHEWAVDLLKKHVSHDAVRHAYLFTGPEGVGRRTLALRLAQVLNCTRPPTPGEPCQTCRACTLIERMQHPDLAVVQAGQAGGTLKVDQVRELQHSLSLAPYEARFRVALLLRFEEANPNAANALLKTLEEPPPQVVLALTAGTSEGLLPTIVSRCEVIRLRPLPIDLVSAGLQNLWGISPEQAPLLAHLSGGRPGFARRLAQDPGSLEKRHAWLEDHRRLLSATRVDRFNYSEALAKDREALREILQVWLSLWRDVLLLAGGASAPPANLDRQDEIESLASRLDLATAHRVVASLERTVDLLDRNVNTRLATDVLMLDLPRF